MTTATILVAGAEPDTTSLQECLTSLGHTVSAAVSCPNGAVEAAARLRPDLALVDLGLDGGSSGFEVAEALAGRCGVPVVYLVGGAEEDLLRRARETDPYGYVLKPFDARQLHLNIDTALAMVERERGLEGKPRVPSRTVPRMAGRAPRWTNGTICPRGSGSWRPCSRA